MKWLVNSKITYELTIQTTRILKRFMGIAMVVIIHFFDANARVFIWRLYNCIFCTPSIPESSKLTTDDASSIGSAATTPTSDLGMEDQAKGPRPICIVKTVDDHDFFLDEKNLASILMKVSGKRRGVAESSAKINYVETLFKSKFRNGERA